MLVSIIGGNTMKRHFGILMALVMAFACFGSTTAFAAEVQPTADVAVVETSNNEVTPCGSLSGYGHHWYNSGESTDGDFYVNVTGLSWPTAQLTLNIENFGPNDAVAVQVYRPDGTFAWGTLDNVGDYITMANKDDWHNIKFTNGKTGTYRIHYSIINWYGETPSSGRINCWIY